MGYVSQHSGQTIDETIAKSASKEYVDALFAQLQQQINNKINEVYPVGSIYMSLNSTSPSSLFGGTWEQIKDKFLLSAGNSFSAGSTGGEVNHTLKEDEMPSHNHLIKSKIVMVSEVAAFQINDSNFDGLVASDNLAETYGVKLTDDQKNILTFSGSSKSHNNMPPYLTVYIWKRVK